MSICDSLGGLLLLDHRTPTLTNDYGKFLGIRCQWDHQLMEDGDTIVSDKTIRMQSCLREMRNSFTYSGGYTNN